METRVKIHHQVLYLLSAPSYQNLTQTYQPKPISFCLCPLLHLGVLYLPSFCDDVDDNDMGDNIGWL